MLNLQNVLICPRGVILSWLYGSILILHNGKEDKFQGFYFKDVP